MSTAQVWKATVDLRKRAVIGSWGVIKVDMPANATPISALTSLMDPLASIEVWYAVPDIAAKLTKHSLVIIPTGEDLPGDVGEYGPMLGTCRIGPGSSIVVHVWSMRWSP